MEDLPTLHGPRNKTMGLEVISPSAQLVTKTDTEREGSRSSLSFFFQVTILSCNNTLYHIAEYETDHTCILFIIFSTKQSCGCWAVKVYLGLCPSNLNKNWPEYSLTVPLTLHPECVHVFPFCTTRCPRVTWHSLKSSSFILST